MKKGEASTDSQSMISAVSLSLATDTLEGSLNVENITLTQNINTVAVLSSLTTEYKI